MKWSHGNCTAAGFEEAENALRKEGIKLSKIAAKYKMGYVSLFVLDGHIDIRGYVHNDDDKPVIDTWRCPNEQTDNR